MNTSFLIPSPGQSIAVPLASLSLVQRWSTALLWVNFSTGQEPLQLVSLPDKRSAYLAPPPGSIAAVLIRELGVDLWEAQALNRTGFPALLTPLKDCSVGARLLILTIALFLLTPNHPDDLEPGQGAVIGLWANELRILPTDIEPYLRLHGPLVSRFMVGKLASEN